MLDLVCGVKPFRLSLDAFVFVISFNIFDRCFPFKILFIEIPKKLYFFEPFFWSLDKASWQIVTIFSKTLLIFFLQSERLVAVECAGNLVIIYVDVVAEVNDCLVYGFLFATLQCRQSVVDTFCRVVVYSVGRIWNTNTTEGPSSAGFFNDWVNVLVEVFHKL